MQNQGASVSGAVYLVGDTPYADKFIPKEKGVWRKGIIY